MKVVICKDAKEVGLKAAALVGREIKKKPGLVLGLATGKTMIGFYRELVKLLENVNVSGIKSFNLDEYVGLSLKDRESFRYYMEKNLFGKLDFGKGRVNFLDGKAKDRKAECDRYEKKIRRVGIDLQVLGMGENGHIGFNEPGSSFKSKTRSVVLTASTRRVNGNVPSRALTMGIGTIMSARKIVLLAFGKRKAKAIAGALEGEVGEDRPGSVLRRHRDVTFILDKSAASALSTKQKT